MVRGLKWDKTKQVASILLLCGFSYFPFSFLLMETAWAASKISVERWVDLALISSTFTEDYLPLSSSLATYSLQIRSYTCVSWQAKKLDVAVGLHWRRVALCSFYMHVEARASLQWVKITLASGSFVRLCAQANKNIYSNICEPYSDTRVRCTRANTQAYGHTTVSSVFLKFLSVLPPPSSLQPSLLRSEWQLGRRLEQRREKERGRMEALNKWTGK